MKAILIVDMPRSCAECPLRTSLEANYLYCIATLPRLKIDPMTASNIKEHKCPLKLIPQKREPKEEWLNEYHRDEFADGWNACLEEIEK